MRVLVVNRYWQPSGGVEVCVRDLVGALEDRDHEVVPFAMSAPESWPTPYAGYFASRVDFHSVSALERLRAVRRSVVSRDSRRALRRLLDDHPVDVAHVFNAYHHLGSKVLLELHRRHIPVVLSLHDYKVACPNVILYSERTGEVCTTCLDHRLGFAWAPWIVRCRGASVAAGLVLSAEAAATNVHSLWRRVPTVVTVLNPLQQRAAERAGVDPGRIHLLPNPVDLGPPRDERARGSHVLYAGRLIPPKGVDVLVRACAEQGLPLRVVGDGEARADLEALARAVGADATFAGQLGDERVADEMAAAGVVAVPSRWPDVAPLVVAEAWAAGAPVVGSDLGGVAGMLAEGRGWLVPPGDPGALGRTLRTVLGDAEAARESVARGRAHATGALSRDRWLDGLRSVYRAAGVEL